jgi:hypothetical protein
MTTKIPEIIQEESLAYTNDDNPSVEDRELHLSPRELDNNKKNYQT